MTIPLASATTGNSDNDGEMRGAAFFNSAKFAQARYTATKFRSLGGNQYAADGTLSLRGASKPVTLTFTWTPGAKPVLAGKATVKRLDFGVGGGEWADTDTIPNEIAVSTKVVLQPRSRQRAHAKGLEACASRAEQKQMRPAPFFAGKQRARRRLQADSLL